jgi:hypothetical protein
MDLLFRENKVCKISGRFRIKIVLTLTVVAMFSIPHAYGRLAKTLLSYCAIRGLVECRTDDVRYPQLGTSVQERVQHLHH